MPHPREASSLTTHVLFPSLLVAPARPRSPPLAPALHYTHTGIYGMDFFVCLTRPGRRITQRKRCRKRMGVNQRITKEDAMKWFQAKFDGVIMAK